MRGSKRVATVDILTLIFWPMLLRRPMQCDLSRPLTLRLSAFSLRTPGLTN